MGMCASLRRRACMHVCHRMRVYMCVSTCACVYLRGCARENVCVCANICVCVCACMCTRVHEGVYLCVQKGKTTFS